MNQLKHLLLPLAAFALAACRTTAPVVDRFHPASAEAAEAPERPSPRSLSEDEHTQRTDELLAKREAQAKAAESDGGNDIAPTKKPTGHEHHH